MTGLDIFALIVLLVLIACGLVGWGLLAIFPGKIANQRNHPQAEAINVCGWWGALTMGILSPVAFIWAFTNPAASLSGREKSLVIPEDKVPGAENSETPA